MDIQQEINFQLKEIFEKQEIVFAYPTQTILLTNENSK
jgi:small-conductance mechanosensitive channel